MNSVGPCPLEHARTGHFPRRLNVAITPETVRALERVIEREGISLTEAVRRLTGYGEFVYKAVTEDGMELLLRDSARAYSVDLS